MRAFVSAAWAILLRDYRVRFRRTLLGVLWVFVPLFTLIAMALFVGKGMGFYDATDADNYLLRLVAGLICWQLFADAWLEPMRLARRASGILRSVTFDQRTLLAAGALSALVAFVIKLPVLIAVLIWLQPTVTQSAWLLPLGIVLLLASGAALACFTLPVSLALLDIRYAMPFVQYALLLATPIFYAQPDKGLLFLINRYNPFSYLVPSARDLLTGPAPDGVSIIVASLVAAAILAAGLHYFRAKIRLAIAYIGR